jgi:protein-tyrosine phosphatase
VIDLHCHVLPGIDDGPPSMDESLELARVAWESGIDTIVATPHVSYAYPHNRAATIAVAVDEVNAALGQAGIDLTVLPGAEVELTTAHELDDAELHQLHLGGGPWLLLEAPLGQSSQDVVVGGIARDLQLSGHQVLLAHPERSPVFQRNPALLASLVRDGMLCQVTAASFAGRFGRTARSFALRMLEEGLVHNVASDAHDAVRRPPSIAAELEDEGLGGLAAHVALDVPSAIVSGGRLPRMAPIAAGSPGPSRRRRLLRRGRA